MRWPDRPGLGLGVSVATVPLLVIRTPLALMTTAAAVCMVMAACWPRAGWSTRWPLRWAPVAVTAVAVGGSALGVLRADRYAPVGALAVGALGYAYLAVADVGRRGIPDRALLSVGLIALGGAGLAGCLLLAAAWAPALAGWAVVGGLLAALAAALLALQV